MANKSDINDDRRELHPGTRYYVTIDGETYDVYIDDGEEENAVVLGRKTEHSVKVSQKNQPWELRISKGSRIYPATVDCDGGDMTVFFGCREAKTVVKTERDLLYDKYRASSATDEKELKIVSPLPGLVTKVQAEQGMQLKKGDGIVIIEAMKMENEIQAPRDCTVRELNVEQGRTIDKGHVIAVLE